MSRLIKMLKSGRYADSKAYMPQKALIEGKVYQGLSDFIMDNALDAGNAVIFEQKTSEKVIAPEPKEGATNTETK